MGLRAEEEGKACKEGVSWLHNIPYLPYLYIVDGIGAGEIKIPACMHLGAAWVG